MTLLIYIELLGIAQEVCSLTLEQTKGMFVIGFIAWVIHLCIHCKD